MGTWIRIAQKLKTKLPSIADLRLAGFAILWVLQRALGPRHTFKRIGGASLLLRSYSVECLDGYRRCKQPRWETTRSDLNLDWGNNNQPKSPVYSPSISFNMWLNIQKHESGRPNPAETERQHPLGYTYISSEGNDGRKLVPMRLSGDNRSNANGESIQGQLWQQVPDVSLPTTTAQDLWGAFAGSDLNHWNDPFMANARSVYFPQEVVRAPIQHQGGGNFIASSNETTMSGLTKADMGTFNGNQTDHSAVETKRRSQEGIDLTTHSAGPKCSGPMLTGCLNQINHLDRQDMTNLRMYNWGCNATTNLQLQLVVFA
ncbi:predicted protein [Uncinocarpus reesii 1704]|uniref:Uncharacterized protein n=1 Tax=Uncinocarpus reesii (strain UAMH 1704) TaxID=336963 RepID=C4JIK4_UNCRE|nr:uncharacterized protein UREG_01541 [Uncinocarpus reesii 1704]EEP76692.1 predicted protein [Uncinocarpus reesii 1704]